MNDTFPSDMPVTFWSPGLPPTTFPPTTFRPDRALVDWFAAHPGAPAGPVLGAATWDVDDAVAERYRTGDRRRTAALPVGLGVPGPCGTPGHRLHEYCPRCEDAFEEWVDDVYSPATRGAVTARQARAGTEPASTWIRADGIVVHDGRVWPVYAAWVRRETLDTRAVAGEAFMLDFPVVFRAAGEAWHRVVAPCGPVSWQSLIDVPTAPGPQGGGAGRTSAVAPGMLFSVPAVAPGAGDEGPVAGSRLPGPLDALGRVWPDLLDRFLDAGPAYDADAPQDAGPAPDVRVSDWFHRVPGMSLRHTGTTTRAGLADLVRESVGWPAAVHPGQDTVVRGLFAARPGPPFVSDGQVWPTFRVTGPGQQVRAVVAALSDRVRGGVCPLDAGTGPSGSNNNGDDPVMVTLLVPYRFGVADELDEAFADAVDGPRSRPVPAGVSEYLVLPGSRPQVFAVEEAVGGSRVLRKVLTTGDEAVAGRVAGWLTLAAEDGGLAVADRTELLGFAEEHLSVGSLGAVRDELDRLARV